MTTHVAHFTITGEFVTEHARELCDEGAWEEGYRFLTEYVHGMDHDTAIAILSGQKRITGEACGPKNTLALADEDETVRDEIDERYRYQWAGIVRERPHYWRPYAYVTNLGPNDLGAAEFHGNLRVLSRKPTEVVGLRTLKSFNEGRCCDYMNDGRNDRIEACEINGSKCFTLFERVDCPPIWIKPIGCHPGCWQEAVDAYIESHGELEERGHVQKYRHLELFDEYLQREERRISDEEHAANLGALERTTEKARKLTPDEINAEVEERLGRVLPEDDSERDDFLRQQMADQIAQLSGLDPDAIEGTMAHVFGNGDEDECPEPVDPSADTKYGWIVPNGTFYACHYHGHSDLARRIFRFVEKMDEPPADGEKAGDDAGWVRVTKSAIGGEFKAYCTRTPTERQKRTLEDWCAWHRLDPEDVLEKL